MSFFSHINNKNIFITLFVAFIFCVESFQQIHEAKDLNPKRYGGPLSYVDKINKRAATTDHVILQRHHNDADIHVCFDVVADDLSSPTEIVSSIDNSNRLFILEKSGIVQIYDGNNILDTPFIDISDIVESELQEQGLLGMAFHPNYSENGLFYLHFTLNNSINVVTRYKVNDDDINIADTNSAFRILTAKEATEFNNGGQLIFGPDGYLYIAIGDSSGGTDDSQLIDSFLGKILRIDVNSDDFPADDDENYAIPQDNPFDNEVWALGLRNPWRNCFDSANGDFYIVDVGEDEYEEVNFELATHDGGNNYGWPIMEGRECHDPPTECNQTGLVLPVAGYSRTQDNRCAIIGGIVYRGTDSVAYPQMEGKYFYGDFCTGELFVAERPSSDSAAANSEWETGFEEVDIVGVCDDLSTPAPAIALVAFTESEEGDMYIVGFGGQLVRIQAVDAPDNSASSRLSSMLLF